MQDTAGQQGIYQRKEEHILDILVDRCTPAEGKAIVQDLIKNEEFHYIELTHNQSSLIRCGISGRQFIRTVILNGLQKD